MEQAWLEGRSCTCGFNEEGGKVSSSCEWQSGWRLGGPRRGAPGVPVCWGNLDAAPVRVMAWAMWAHAEEQSSLAVLATTEIYLQRDLGTLQLLHVPAQTQKAESS